MYRPSRHAGKLFSPSDTSSLKVGSSSFLVEEFDLPSPTKNAALIALEEKLGREEAHELHELFKLVDRDGGGSISHEEFIELLSTMSVRPTPEEMELMYKELDQDEDGQRRECEKKTA